MSEAPKMIWLQYYGDSSPDEVFDEDDGYEVTWCKDPIFTHDIPYSRVPWLPEERVKQLRDLRKQMEVGARTRLEHEANWVIRNILSALEVKK